MALIGSSILILGLVVASVIANYITTNEPLDTVPADSITFISDNSDPNKTKPSISTTKLRTSISSTTSNMDITNPSSTIMTSATRQKGETSSLRPSSSTFTTPKSIRPFKRTTTTTTTRANTKGKGTSAKPQIGYKNDNVGIIILIVIIVLAVAFAVTCIYVRKRGRRYSVDFASRPEEANIPLSTVDPEMLADPAAHNGLQTFESIGTTKEPEEPAAKPEEQEEQKVDNKSAEADKSVADATAESAAPAPSPESPGDKPKEEVAEQSLPAPAQLSMEEKNDEGAISDKSSVESLKETNKNNSNNADFGQKKDLVSSKVFWDIALDCPV